MRVSVRENIIPGRDMVERFGKAAVMGFEAIDLGWRSDLPERVPELHMACRDSGLPISSVSCGPNDLLALRPEDRERSLEFMVRLLELADELGAVGSVCVPIRNSVPFPDLSPAFSTRDLVSKLAAEMLAQLVYRTRDLKPLILLEPLNRYEAYYLRTLSDAVELAQAVGDRRVAIVADFFHMNIEEPDVPASIQSAGEWIQLVHLGDSNRMLPGQGHIDFASGFAALKEIAYNGFVVLECGILGDPEIQLPRSVQFVKGHL